MEHPAVGKGAADVHADQKPCHFLAASVAHGCGMIAYLLAGYVAHLPVFVVAMQRLHIDKRLKCSARTRFISMRPR